MKLLIAEDDEKLLKSLLHIFEKNKYIADGVSNGRDALDFALQGDYDGIILDVMMPELDGIEVLKSIRAENSTVPVLFLTAKTEIYQRVEGLDAGADDYLSKPFSIQELLARVRAMLRRKENYVPDRLCCGDFILNRSTYEIAFQEHTAALSGKEFQIVEFLMQRTGCIVTGEQLLSHVWGWESESEISTLWMHISNIRKKIAAINAPVQIKFVRNAGYLLEESV